MGAEGTGGGRGGRGEGCGAGQIGWGKEKRILRKEACTAAGGVQSNGEGVGVLFSVGGRRGGGRESGSGGVGRGRGMGRGRLVRARGVAAVWRRQVEGICCWWERGAGDQGVSDLCCGRADRYQR